VKRLLAFLAAAAAFATGAAALSLAVAPFEVPPFGLVKSGWSSSDAWLLDRHGERLSRVRIDMARRRGEWTALADASPALADAAIAAEDRRFFAHAGVDWLGLAGAAWDSGAGARRGGSTVTMQLVALLHPELERSGRRGAPQKWRQLRQALALERRWSKAEVLEAWLNLAAFRGELEGVDAAARALFGKRPSGLERAESALLAAMLRSPNAAAATLARRACALLRDAGACEQARRLAAQGLRPRAQRLDGDAPHLARRLLSAPGERRRSTLDARLQRFAAETLERHLRELEGRNVADGALVVLENASGEVRAWVGSSGELSSAAEVDGVSAPRLPGSTLKPFLYAYALERRLLTAASILDDTPAAIITPSGLYVPQNYDRLFRGRVSLRTALASSLNVPAVRTLALVGYEPFYRRLRALDLVALGRDADHYGYALALGGAESTLLALANAYRTLANGGRHAAPRLEPGGAPAPGEAVLDPRAAYVVSDILADAAARAVTFGLRNPLATRYAASVKTGTSTDMRDNWAIGFSARYTVAVWVGNFSGEPMHDVSGITGAAPVWREVMDFLHEGEAPEPPAAPPGLVRTQIAYADGIEPPRGEWFLAGTETPVVTAIAGGAARPRIVAPANGALLAVDPDIPEANQRVALRVAGAPVRARLELDGRPFPAGVALWLPEPGRHELRLLGERDEVLDRVRFTVRLPKLAPSRRHDSTR
jgi:penicillin-binding protein 1C